MFIFHLIPLTRPSVATLAVSVAMSSRSYVTETVIFPGKTQILLKLHHVRLMRFDHHLSLVFLQTFSMFFCNWNTLLIYRQLLIYSKADDIAGVSEYSVKRTVAVTRMYKLVTFIEIVSTSLTSGFRCRRDHM